MSKSLIDLVEGDELGHTDWITIDQQTINQFADSTNDHQWIHVDQARCETESPFGMTIAHGLLSTALMPDAFYHLIELDSAKQTLLNYGIDSLRFLEPVRVNDRIRYHVNLENKTTKSTGILYRFNTQVEIENRDKPAMIGKFLMLLIQ
ncbi:MaoC family dehydratase [Aliiglaciecola sp. 3_MG-2023]|uniref:MaoC family dehydratase n=1 Tax=Aliiglaciecola sp. 3_MG-2023 TaxID=3062644 RepID=UPI0026E2CFBC|nr:MaoC family dehydratase [Aliiglaciecola sp. 3_MG-2023]MDO6693821.1 MaoC family dehydratase [Aliiglaciecola sp. 3_MG-2023]